MKKETKSQYIYFVVEKIYKRKFLFFRVLEAVNNCGDGHTDIKAAQQLADEYGIREFLGSGGRKNRKYIREYGVDCIRVEK